MGRKFEAGSEGWGRRTHVMRTVPMVIALLLVGCTESPAAPRRLPPVAQPEQPSTPPPAPAAPTPEPPPAPLKVLVAVVTTGVELDPDGYKLVVYDESAAVYAYQAIGANGAVILELSPGNYLTHLAGIAPNCTPVEPENHIGVYADSSSNAPELFASLGVTCLAIPASQGVRVTTVNTGESASSLGFEIEITSEDGAAQFFMQSRSIGMNESVTVPSPAGSFFVYLRGLDCSVASPLVQRVRVDPNQTASLTFNVSCPP